MTEKQFQGRTAPLVDDLGDGSHVPLVKPVGPGVATLSQILDRLPTAAHAQPLTDQQLRAAPVATVATTPATEPYGSGTREHNTATITRQAVGAASARIALPALGASREVYVMSSTRCFCRTGDSTVTASAGTSHPLAVDERFYFRVPAGHTHIAYVRDSADGFITVCAVV